MGSKSDLQFLLQRMDGVIDDSGVPRNIRKSVSDAKTSIQKETTDVNITTAIYTLDECLNDINMPFHVRPELMELIAELERFKEEMKGD